MSRKLGLNSVCEMYNVKKEDVMEIVENSRSKSETMKKLYGELEIDVSSVRDIMVELVESGISYNFCYNVLSRTFGDVRKRNEGEPKSSVIRQLYYKDYSVKDIVMHFVTEKNEYVNENYVRSVIRKEKKKESNEK